MKTDFRHISGGISEWAGSTTGFVFSIIGVIVWLTTGPYFHFSDTWLIAITAITDVIIFVMVFSIQGAQNRDSKAIRLKLNELIASNNKARDTFIGLEELTDNELAELDDEFQQLLNNLETPASMKKLHKAVKHEKARRPAFYEQAEHLVGDFLSPIAGKIERKH